MGFTNSFFSGKKITEKDVELRIPKGFPKPVYDFSKNKITVDGFLLGKKLFYDTILSIGNISCASCHQPFAAFANLDHPFSHGINGQLGTRNTPALQNLIWQKNFMWDGGVNNLDLQPIAPMTHSLEMGDTLSNIINKLQENKEYVKMFKKAFKDDKIISKNMLKAISQFLALFISADSKYDRYIAGKEKFNDSELKGLQLFRSNCASCHQEPLFTDGSFRNNGLKPELDDHGRMKITGLEEDDMKFKVPSLRNVAYTFPYMHDGRFENLQTVLNYYTMAKLHNANEDALIPKIRMLTTTDKAYLIEFLKTLTDTTFINDQRFIATNAPKIIIPDIHKGCD